MNYPRVNYEITQEELDSLLAEMKPQPAMYLSGGTLLGRDPQERANEAWELLGKKHGFDYMTVRPIPGKDARHFSAVPLENKEEAESRINLERIKERRGRIRELELLKRTLEDEIEFLETQQKEPS